LLIPLFCYLVQVVIQTCRFLVLVGPTIDVLLKNGLVGSYSVCVLLFDLLSILQVQISIRSDTVNVIDTYEEIHALRARNCGSQCHHQGAQGGDSGFGV
jgi:hypothetical protein